MLDILIDAWSKLYRWKKEKGGGEPFSEAMEPTTLTLPPRDHGEKSECKDKILQDLHY